MNDIPPVDTLYSSAATGNQWYEVGIGIIAGATFNYFVPAHDGLYYVVVTDSNGCASMNSDTANHIYSFIKGSYGSGSIRVFPNPTHDNLIIALDANFVTGDQLIVILYDVIGRKVFEYSTAGMPEIHLSISSLAPAVYMLELRGARERFITRV